MGTQFRVAGIPVRIDASLVLVLALFGLGLEDPVLIVAWIAIGVVSILLHELGHALAYRRYGQNASIVLYAFGGLTQGEAGLPPKRSLVVSLAGPFSQLLLFGLPLLLLGANVEIADPFWRQLLAVALFINIGWPLFNLLPVLPLDGGNVLSSAVELVKPGRGMRVAQWVSVVVASCGAVLAAMTGWIFLAAFGAFFAFMNWQALQRANEPVRGSAHDELLAGYAALLEGDVSAGRLAATRVASDGHADAAVAAEELRLWSLVAERDAKRLERALALRGDASPPPALLLAAAALLDGRTEEGLSTMAWSLQNDPVRPAVALAVDLVAERGLVQDLVADLLVMEDSVRAVRTLQAGLHHRRRFAEAASVGAAFLQAPLTQARSRDVQAEVAADVAASAARAGDIAAGAAWLAWAAGAGWQDLDRLDTDGDLAPLRELPEVQALRSRLAGSPR